MSVDWQSWVAERWDQARWVEPDRISCERCRRFAWWRLDGLGGEGEWQKRGGRIADLRFGKERSPGRPRRGATDADLRHWAQELRSWTDHLAYRRRDPERRRAHLRRVLSQLLLLRRPHIQVNVPVALPALPAPLTEDDWAGCELLLTWRLATSKLRRPGYSVRGRLVEPSAETLDLVHDSRRREMFGYVLAIHEAGRNERRRGPIYDARWRARILASLFVWHGPTPAVAGPWVYVQPHQVERAITGHAGERRWLEENG
ncbi:MAG: hypothetical protein JSU87_15200 [Gemmatimonadota bacterium]|nr:MAG: hypothetical protein JSU87_15200 [Gemmatimonadota bacterium]